MVADEWSRNDRAWSRVGAVMTTVGFIGSGRIAGTLARVSVAAGHPVVLSDPHGPETLKDLVVELGPLASATTGEQAAEPGDIVVVRVPLGSYPSVPVKPMAGKVVLDACYYDPQRDGQVDTWTPAGSPAASCCSGT
jgi:predicted dinucleotide-binding enzyme